MNSSDLEILEWNEEIPLQRDVCDVRHIFGGILENKIDVLRSPEENLHVLRSDFERLGISIGQSSVLHNSTLLKLVREINFRLNPARGNLAEWLAFNRFIENQEGDWRVGQPREIVQKKKSKFNVLKNFRISIWSGVLVGMDVLLSPGLSIGDNCRICQDVSFSENVTVGDGTVMQEKVVIADDVNVGSYTVLKHCSFVGPNSIIENYATILDYAVVGREKRVKDGFIVDKNDRGRAVFRRKRRDEIILEENEA